jgi:hypothetical protein
MELDGSGSAVAVWTANGPGFDGRVTQAATRPPGGAWTPPVTLSPPEEDGGWDPAVAVGPDGDAVVVWSSVRHDGGRTRQIVLAVTRDAGGRWSAPIAISDDSEIALSFQPEVVVDGDGTATAIWSEETGEAAVLRTRTRPRGGAWGPPVDLTDRFVGWEPQLAVDPHDNVTAVWNWRNVPEHGSGIIQSKFRPAGGAWSADPVDLSDDGESALEPQLAVDPDGRAVAVWYSYTGDDSVVRAARRTAQGEWGLPVDLSGDDPAALLPHVAIDSHGTATAVWESHDDAGRIMRASTSVAGESWSNPVDISVRDGGPWSGGFPQVAADREGDVTAIWEAWYPDRFSIVQAARREAGSGWGPPVDLGKSNGVIERRPIAVDPRGYVTAVWARGKALQSSVFDAVPPLLRDVAVPATGVVGQPVAMSVDPFDVWSAVTARWAFGDGGSGTGAATGHCFRTPGERTVTITGTDAAANVTTTTRTIAIAADPALPAGADPCAGPGPGPGPRPGPDPGPGTDPGPGPGPGPAPRPDPDPVATAPAISGLQQTSARWRTARAGAGRSRQPVGTTFRFRLDRAAQVRLEFDQTTAGRRIRGACAKATVANRGKPRCSRVESRGTLTVAGRAGENAVRFRGRLGRRTLAPGRYRLRVTAVADGKRSAAVSLSFTIVR